MKRFIDPQRAAPRPSSRTLRRLWERMVSLYGHVWVSAHGLTPTEIESARLTMSGDTWARALSGLSDSQIALGLAQCIAEGAEYAPSAPRFRAMCHAIPSLASVRSELRIKASGSEQVIPSALARAVWAEMDTFRYRQASADQADRLLRETYELVVERTLGGVPLPEDPVAVITNEARTPVPATPEQRAKHIANIQEMLDRSSSGDRPQERHLFLNHPKAALWQARLDGQLPKSTLYNSTRAHHEFRSRTH